MKNVCAFLFVLILTIYAQAQNSNTATVEETKSAATNEPRNASAVGGRFNLPPEKTRPVRAALFVVPPVIDGKLDDETWRSAQVLKDFYQTSPGDNIAPSKPTEAMIGYDEKHLYIAFRCFDEPDKIRATVAQRDNVFGEDNVRVWLDTYNDQRRAYVLGFNPHGIQQDGIYTEGQGDDFSVDIVMESKGAIEDWGWSVEVKIPFKSLRYSAGRGKLWGFNVARNIDRFNDEIDKWLPDDRNITGILVESGKLAGLDEIKTERTLEIAPSITVGETGRRTRTIPRFILNDPNTNPNGELVDPGRFVNQPIRQDIGVTVKFNLTPNVTLDAAYNPDFAEIEADAPVVSANQRFPIFFEEKRPFFLEGVEIFQSPLNVFYSRTIVDPDIAAKLTGKIGKTSFGFLAASDKAPGNYDEDDRNDPSIRPRVDEFLDKNALFGVLRLKRDIGRENNVGFFGTYRGFPEQRNLLGGFDGRFKLDERTVMEFQTVGTHSRRCFFDAEFEPFLNPVQARRNREICGGGSFGGVTVFGSPFNQFRTGNGFGYVWSLDYTEKNRGYLIQATGRTKDYRADAGFTRRTNTNNVFLAGRLSTEPKPKARLIRFDWRPSVSGSFDWQGRSQDFNAEMDFSFSLQRNTYFSVETGASFERIFEEEFGLKRSVTRSGAFFGAGERSAWQQYVNIDFSTTVNKRISFGVAAGYARNALDFDFGGGARFPRVSLAYQNYLNELVTNPNAEEPALDPGTGRQFNFDVAANFRPTDPLRITFEYSKSRLTRSDTGKTAFDADIFTLRSTYQFTRFTFVRARLDYDSLSSNASGQLLFGWNPNPGTALYFGYNDDFNYNGFSPFTGQLEPRFERNSRTFFIRASYLFRKSF